MFTEVERLRHAIEHAPQDPGKIAVGLLGWNFDDGNFVCAHCAGRIMARGCRVPPNSHDVWKNVNKPAGPCCCCQPAAAPEPQASPPSLQVSPEAAAKIIAAAVAIFQSVECVNRGVWQVPHKVMRNLVAELTAAGVEV